MIVDLIENSALYAHIDDRLAIGLKYLQTTDFSNLEPGKYLIKDHEVFAMVSDYNSKLAEDARWEAHRKYADIQYLVHGEEQMGYAPVREFEASQPYNPDNDIVFLVGRGDYISVRPGMFVIFFPQDAHQPGVAITESMPVRKVVVKVLM